MLARLRQQTTVTRERSRRIQSDSGPSEVSPSNQLSASLERTINHAWQNNHQEEAGRGSEDHPGLVNNDSQEEVEDTEMKEFFNAGEVIVLLKKVTKM